MIVYPCLHFFVCDIDVVLFYNFCDYFLQPMANDDDFSEVQKAVISGRVSTVVPIEIARRHQNPIVREELLLRTDVNQEEGSVYWHGLRLLVLDLSWIRKIHWVKRLRLARNGFRSIPNEIGGYLKQVRDDSNIIE